MEKAGREFLAEAKSGFVYASTTALFEATLTPAGTATVGTPQAGATKSDGSDQDANSPSTEATPGAGPSGAGAEPHKGVYGEWCQDPSACRDKGYCPLECGN